jgi:hypothetical protein|tara:strand:+ start:7464 stop:7658 length:195 start_codon:yes stop_codon:yes gene_type:complete
MKIPVNEQMLILEEENNDLRELLKESRDFLAKIGTLKPIIMQECKDLIEKINNHRTYKHNNVST